MPYLASRSQKTNILFLHHVVKTIISKKKACISQHGLLEHTIAAPKVIFLQFWRLESLKQSPTGFSYVDASLPGLEVTAFHRCAHAHTL